VEKKTDLLFTRMLLNVNITLLVDIQFSQPRFSVKTVDCSVLVKLVCAEKDAFYFEMKS